MSTDFLQPEQNSLQPNSGDNTTAPPATKFTTFAQVSDTVLRKAVIKIFIFLSSPPQLGSAKSPFIYKLDTHGSDI